MRMPLFMIGREFADQFVPQDEMHRLIDDYNATHEQRWLTSFLSADKNRTHRRDECADIEMLRQHAADLGIPLTQSPGHRIRSMTDPTLTTQFRRRSHANVRR